MRLIEHADFATLADRLAGRLADALERAIAERGRGLAALAGGSTPLPVYRRLSGFDLEWSRVTLLPGDERWVRHAHPACNLKALRNAFGPVAAEFAALTPVEASGPVSSSLAEQALERLGGPLDAALLGMGEDGHFASLFPGAPELADALDPDAQRWCTTVHPEPLPTEAPFARVSLTLAALLGAPTLILAIRGSGKRHALGTAQAASDPLRYPVCALLEQAGERLEIHWSP